MMETRGFALATRDADADHLTVEGRAVVYDALSEDLGGFRERFARGALTRTLSHGRDVGLLYSHDSAAVLASTRAGSLELEEDPQGLAVRARLDRADPDVQRLDAKLRAGTVDKMSFGFRAVRDDWSEEDGQLIRSISEAELIETSAVWLPAYTATSLEGRGRLSDVSFGAFASMPPHLAQRLLDELRVGKVLSKSNAETLRKVMQQLQALLEAAERGPKDDEDRPGHDEDEADRPHHYDDDEDRPGHKDKDEDRPHHDDDEDRARLARRRRRLELLELAG